VTLRTDPTQDARDRFGRLLAYVTTTGGRDLGREQVRVGWANVFVFERPFQRVGAYRSSARQARAADRGVWGLCGGNFHTAATPVAAPQATQRTTYSPFDASGAPAASLQITARSGGECTTSSRVAGAVCRCIVGSLLHDPCYLDALASAQAGVDVVLCVDAPWSRAAVRLRLDSLDRGAPAGSGGPPWALELADGSRCVFVTGATTVVGGRRLNYACGRTRVLFGEPDRSRSVWRIRMARDATGANMTTVPIRVAWS
jgi:hypothetical protein